MIDIQRKGNEIKIIIESPEELEGILKDQFEYYGFKGNLKSDYKKTGTSMKDFFINKVLKGKEGQTLDNFFKYTVFNVFCPYDLDRFIKEIILDKEAKKYFSLTDLLNYATGIEGHKNHVRFFNQIINSYCPYSEFEDEKKKIKENFREFMSNFLGDYFFKKREKSLAEKIDKFKRLEKILSHNYDRGLNSEQETNKLKKDLDKRIEEISENIYRDIKKDEKKEEKLREMEKELYESRGWVWNEEGEINSNKDIKIDMKRAEELREIESFYSKDEEMAEIVKQSTYAN